MRRIKKLLRRLLWAVSLLFVALVLVVLVRTLRFQSKQLRSLERIPAAQLDEDAVKQHLIEALQFQTESHEDTSKVDAAEFLKLHQFLKEAFPKVHATLTREIVGNYSLLYTWKTSEPSQGPMLLMSHMDVVPVEKGTEQDWTHGPYVGKLADGYIWGRGTLDIKSGMMGILEAVEHHLDKGFKPGCDIYLAFGHDEEVGGKDGNARIAAMLAQQRVRLRYVLDEGGVIAEGIIPGVSKPVAFVPVAEKGYAGVKLIADANWIRENFGEELVGHSSMPPRHTTVGLIGLAVHRLETSPFPARISKPTGYLLDYLGPEMGFSEKVAMANRWLFGPLIKRRLSANRGGCHDPHHNRRHDDRRWREA